ncbi:hypothetical protein ACI782_03595 [Geodermatophilus sp. SYSU D00703]
MWSTSWPHGEPDEEYYRRMSAPGNEIPVALSDNLLLARTHDVAIALVGLQVYTTGISFDLSVRVRPGALPGTDVQQLLWRHGPGAPALLVGVELADGTRVDNVPRQEPGEDIVFTESSGSADERSATQTWWLSPVPGEGSLRVVVRCPELGITETAVELDATPIRQAVERVVELWPWVPPELSDPEPPQRPDLPDDSWFAHR